jgi:lambda family phage minor tail protein L
MIELSTEAMMEKNKLLSNSVFLLLLEVTIPNTATPVRIIANTEDISWRGYDWIAFPFDIDDINETAEGDSATLTLKIGNTDRVMEQYIMLYDAWLKSNPHQNIQVTMYVVNSNNLADTNPEVSYNFEVISYTLDSQWASFTMGGTNLFNYNFPITIMYPNSCRWKYKSTECGAVSALTTCNKTITDCRARNNSGRFGAFPSLGTRFTKVV